jgi:flagellar hook protein FlgE
MADGASRFVSNGNALVMTQEPGAAQLKINAVSNSTTGLGSSIVESGANEGTDGPASSNLGQFTIPAIWSGGTVAEPQSYSQAVAGTQSFTITAPTATSMPTGFFQVGGDAISWSDVEAGTDPIPLYTVDNTTSPPTYTNTNDDTVSLAGTVTTPATDPLSAAQNLQLVLKQLSATSTAFAGLTVSSVSGTTGNPTTVTLSDTGTAASIFSDASGTNAGTGAVQGSTGEATWSLDGTDGTTSKLAGPTGAYVTAAIGLTFNGDGTPSEGSNVGQSTALPGIVPTSMGVTWANGAENQVQNPGPNTAQQPQVTLNLGSPNETNGMTQLGGTFTVNSLQQNGAKFGTFAGVSISGTGTVTALFNNGVRTPVFEIPVATFPDPDGLESLTGNIFQATTASGGYTVRQAGTGGSGTVSASSLESSTVDIGTQFTDMIVVQRAYSAAAKVITTTDSMLTDLINVIPQ